MGLPDKKPRGIKALNLKVELQKKVDAELNAMPSDISFLDKLHKAARSSRLGKKFLGKAK